MSDTKNNDPRGQDPEADFKSAVRELNSVWAAATKLVTSQGDRITSGDTTLLYEEGSTTAAILQRDSDRPGQFRLFVRAANGDPGGTDGPTNIALREYYVQADDSLSGTLSLNDVWELIRDDSVLPGWATALEHGGYGAYSHPESLPYPYQQVHDDIERQLEGTMSDSERLRLEEQLAYARELRNYMHSNTTEIVTQMTTALEGLVNGSGSVLPTGE